MCRNKLVQITYALANVYDDSPDLDVRVSEEHRAKAEEMMACVESGDVTRLREMFIEVCGVNFACGRGHAASGVAFLGSCELDGRLAAREKGGRLCS